MGATGADVETCKVGAPAVRGIGRRDRRFSAFRFAGFAGFAFARPRRVIARTGGVAVVYRERENIDGRY